MSPKPYTLKKVNYSHNLSMGLPYGLKDNKLVTIKEAQSGLECNCYCPACNKQLLAHKGPLVKNYFAHYGVTDCYRGIEASLQMLCKDIIEQERKMVLPALYFSYSWRSRLAPETEVAIDAVRLENRSGSPLYDIVIESKSRTILVDITVNQRTSRDRVQLLKSKNVFGVELHLPRIVEYLFQRKDFRLKDEGFRNEILYGTTNKFWVHNPLLTEVEDVLKSEYATQRTMYWFKWEHGTYNYVDDCPLKKRVWQGGHKEGQSYATVEDCNHCYFCLSKYDKASGAVSCIGHLKDTLNQLLWKAKLHRSC